MTSTKEENKAGKGYRTFVGVLCVGILEMTLSLRKGHLDEDLKEMKKEPRNFYEKDEHPRHRLLEILLN